jgi:putative PIN family toxin of toxin-antitoxin system
LRAVLDANVLVSAVISREGAGTPAQLLSRWRDGEFELVLSEQLLAEVARVLGTKKLRARVSRADADQFLALLRARTALSADSEPAPRRSPDPGDDYLLALAEAERAVVVTGDQHLLGLGDEYPILTPRLFLETLEVDD